MPSNPSNFKINRVNDSKNQTIEFPNQELKDKWPAIYKEIAEAVKEPIIDKPETPFEEKIRSILRSHLDMDLVKTNEEHRKFFKDALAFAINMHTDKMLYKIEAGRKQYRTTGLKRDNRKN